MLRKFSLFIWVFLVALEPKRKKKLNAAVLGPRTEDQIEFKKNSFHKKCLLSQWRCIFNPLTNNKQTNEWRSRKKTEQKQTDWVANLCLHCAFACLTIFVCFIGVQGLNRTWTWTLNIANCVVNSDGLQINGLIESPKFTRILLNSDCVPNDVECALKCSIQSVQFQYLTKCSCKNYKFQF